MGSREVHMTPIRLAFLATLLLGCGGPQDPATEDLTSGEHEAEADREDALADEHQRQSEEGVNLVYADYNPADAELAQAEEHRAHAQAHRERAEALRSFENAECSHLTESARSACPFLLGLQGVEDIEGGAKLIFGEAQNIDAIADHIRCHLSFVASRGDEGIEDCALYVPGATLHRDANVLILRTDREDQVAELRRRVRVQTTH